MNRSVILLSGGIVALLAFYGFTFWRALHPEVSTSYRAFFIDKTREVMDDDDSQLRSLGPGQRVSHASSDIGFVGFSGVEPEYRWTNSHHSEILFKVKCGMTYSGRVVMELSSHGNQRVVLRLNKGAVQRLKLTPLSDRVMLSFPPSQLSCGTNTLSIDLPDAAAPNESDTRLLGIALRRFYVE